MSFNELYSQDFKDGLSSNSLLIDEIYNEIDGVLENDKMLTRDKLTERRVNQVLEYVTEGCLSEDLPTMTIKSFLQQLDRVIVWSSIINEEIFLKKVRNR